MYRSIILDFKVNNIDLLLKDNIDKRIYKATEALTPIIAEDLHPYVPYDTGNLDSSLESIPKLHWIQFNAEYAGYALNPIAPSGVPKEYNKKVHPKASGTPVEDAYAEIGSKWLKIFEEELKKDV